MNWFDRRFAFDLPAWMYPNLLERLRGTPARLEELSRDLTRDALTRRRGGDWSIQENAGHLLDLEPLWLGRVDDLANGAAQLRPADLENRKTHEADHNSAELADILRAFRTERDELVRRLDGLDDSMVERAARHPRLEQPMRLIDLVFFVAEHDDHHLAQISRLKRTFRQR